MPGPAGGRVPGWVQRVPLEGMPALTHLAFNIVSYSPTETSLLVYVLPAALHGLQVGGSTFRKWIASDNPLDYGFIIERRVDPLGCRRTLLGKMRLRGVRMMYGIRRDNRTICWIVSRTELQK